MNAIHPKIIDLLDDAKSGVFIVPHFQREFVWEPSQTCKLIDSIARNYPIGALLALPSQALLLPSQPMNFEGAVEQKEGKQSFYLLDGQQRLTSIARAMLNADPQRAYFFDLDALYEEIIEKSDSDLPWVVFRKKSNIFTGKENRSGGKNNPYQLLPCCHALQSSMVTAQLMKFLQERTQSDDWAEIVNSEAMQKLTNVFEVVRNYQVFIHQMESNESLEAICRIFETINNTGMSLDTFDLVVAKTYSTSYNLREQLERMVEQFPQLADVTGESLLHVILYCQHLKEKKRPTLSRAALLNADAKLWSTHLESVAEAFNSVKTWLYSNRLGRKDLIPLPLQVVLATMEARYPGVMIRRDVTLEMVKWLLSTAWAVDTYNKSHSTRDLIALDDFFEKASKCSTPLNPVKLECPRLPVITAGEVLSFASHHRNYKVLQVIVMQEAARDIFGYELGDLRHLEDHHIMPRALCDKLGINKRVRDSMANRVLVTEETNNRLVRDHIPENYFQDAKRLLGDGMASRLFDSALITPQFLKGASDLTPSSVTAAIKGRAELIALRVNEYFGTHVINDSEEEDI